MSALGGSALVGSLAEVDPGRLASTSGIPQSESQPCGHRSRRREAWSSGPPGSEQVMGLSQPDPSRCAVPVGPGLLLGRTQGSQFLPNSPLGQGFGRFRPTGVAHREGPLPAPDIGPARKPGTWRLPATAALETSCCFNLSCRSLWRRRAGSAELGRTAPRLPTSAS